jgi:hypothetical protein
MERSARAQKVRENWLRRSAERQGLRLVKSGRRDPRAWDYATYSLIAPHLNGKVLLDGVSADEIEQWLADGPATYHRGPGGQRIDAGPGSIVGVWPGAILDMAAAPGRRFIAEEDGSLRELAEDEWPSSDAAADALALAIERAEDKTRLMKAQAGAVRRAEEKTEQMRARARAIDDLMASGPDGEISGGT